MPVKSEQGKTINSRSELVDRGALFIDKGNSWTVKGFNPMRIDE